MNYKESGVTGTKWRRCCGINIQNPLAPSVPHITFTEEDIINLDNKNISLNSSSFMTRFEPSNVIEILDTETLEPTGNSITEGELYVILFSKYIAIAKSLEPVVVPEPIVIPEPPIV